MCLPFRVFVFVFVFFFFAKFGLAIGGLDSSETKEPKFKNFEYFEQIIVKKALNLGKTGGRYIQVQF